MNISETVTGLQHIGIPTNDIEKTSAFYNSLGFQTIYRTVNKAANPPEPVAFMELKGVVVETWQNGAAPGVNGAIDHIALNVTDIEAAYAAVQAGGYEILTDGILFLDFWESGVKYFSIAGPNGETLEFNQKL